MNLHYVQYDDVKDFVWTGRAEVRGIVQVATVGSMSEDAPIER